MTDKDWNKVYEERKNDPDVTRYSDDSIDYQVRKYREDKNTSWTDKMM